MTDPRPLHERFDLTYVKRRQWPHRWVTPLSVALVLVFGGVLAWMAQRGEQGVYSSGPLTQVHAMFGHDCAQCHQPDPARHGYWLPVADAACLKCHAEATAHHPDRPGARAGVPMLLTDRLAPHPMSDNCTACHSEHRGRDFDLQRVGDATCVACHGQLHPDSASADAAYHAIRSFTRDHPDWRVLAEARVDTTPLRMGHGLHMDPRTPKMQEALRDWRAMLAEAGVAERDMPIQQMRDGSGTLLALTCTACHQSDAAGQYMQPITFEQHCRQCHALGSVRFDGGERAAIPHGQAIAAFLDLTAHQKATRVSTPVEASAPRRGGPRRAPAPTAGDVDAAPAFTFATPEALLEHVNQAVEAERGKLLALVTPMCGKCHGAGVEPTTLMGPNIPDRWLPASRFSHAAHRFMGCLACHADAADTTLRETPGTPVELRWTGRTKDVMLPNIDSCRACHAPTLSGGGVGARHDCVMCHLYHDPPLRGVQGGAFPLGTEVRPLTLKNFAPE